MAIESNKRLKVQPREFAYIRLLNKPYENEVTLTGQNPTLKCCQHIEIQKTVRKRVDLLILKILGLQIKGLQSYWQSNFENYLTSSVLESGLKEIADSSAVKVEECTSAKFDGQ